MIAFDAAVLTAVGFPALGRRFITWRTFPPRRIGGKPVKLPCTPSGYPMDGTDECRWLVFDQAADIATRRKLGLGIALGWGFAGLDLDNCISDAGELTAMASTILRHFPTYTEISPSRHGVKAYFIAGPSFTTTVKRDAKGVELYAGRRFFALTGKPFPGTMMTLADCTAAARALAGVLRPPVLRLVRPPAAPSMSTAARLRDCEPVRERPSIYGGTVHTLAVCPFTGERHSGGGSYAITFPDGAVFFRCDRSSHGQQRDLARAPMADGDRKWPLS